MCEGGIDGFCSTTKYSPFMIYLHLENLLISNSHGSTYYNKLLYVCGGEWYCVLLVNFEDFWFIVHAILLFQVHPKQEWEREGRLDSEKH